MFRTAIILAALGASIAAPGLAQSISEGSAMQARILGLTPGEYSVNELAQIEEARRTGDTVTEQALLNRTTRSGFDSPYFVDAATLSSEDN